MRCVCLSVALLILVLQDGRALQRDSGGSCLPSGNYLQKPGCVVKSALHRPALVVKSRPVIFRM